MSRRIHLIVIMALWKRAYVARFVLHHLNNQRRRLAEHLSLEVLVVGSEGAVSEQLATAHGAYYIEHANHPLGAKWNAVLAAAREHDPDAVMVLGSDNMVNDALLRTWADEIRDGIDYIGLLDNHMYRPSSDTLLYWAGYPDTAANICRVGEPIGSARCFSRALLDRVGWALWDGSLSSSLDYSATCRIGALAPCPRMAFYQVGEIQHLGIKTSTGLTPMERFMRDGSNQLRSVPSEFLAAWYGEDTTVQLRTLTKDKHTDDISPATGDHAPIPGER